MGLKSDLNGVELRGRYLLERLLGRGGMSTVYLATDLRLRRPVAVKMIHDHLAEDADFQRRFEDEATGIARLRHPSIIQVYDYNQEDNTWFMVMEYVEGWTLEAYGQALKERGEKLTIEQAVGFMIGICRAVDYAHQQGIIHRDIKPANIMIRPTGQPVLMDFGIAKMVQSSEKTATGLILGTISYMAPEQIKGDPIDHRVDIYALAVLLFELLTGKRPFESESSVATMQMHLNEPPPDLRDINPSHPPELADLVEKGLAKDPADRFARASDMADALETINLNKAGAVLDPTRYFGPADNHVGGPTTPLPAAAGILLTTPNPNLAQEKEEVPPPLVRPRWLLWVGLVALLMALSLFLLPAGSRAAILSPGSDEDNDGLTAFEEFRAGTDYLAADSDDDGFPDKAELAVDCLDPLNPDVDGDGIIDGDDPLACEPAEAAALPQQVDILAVEIVQGDGLVSSVDGGEPSYDSDGEMISPEGDDSLHYQVSFETVGFTPQPRDFHIHFFYDNVAPENAGVPGDGPWEVHQIDAVFQGFPVSEKPADASRICVVVANPDHTITVETARCHDLPDS